MSGIILAVVAVIAPFVAGFLAGELSKFNAFINGLPTPFPALIGVGVAFGLAALAQFLGVALPGDLAGLTQDVIAAVLVAIAHLFFPTAVALKSGRVRMGLRH